MNFFGLFIISNLNSRLYTYDDISDEIESIGCMYLVYLYV